MNRAGLLSLLVVPWSLLSACGEESPAPEGATTPIDSASATTSNAATAPQPSQSAAVPAPTGSPSVSAQPTQSVTSSGTGTTPVPAPSPEDSASTPPAPSAPTSDTAVPSASTTAPPVETTGPVASGGAGGMPATEPSSTTTSGGGGAPPQGTGGMGAAPTEGSLGCTGAELLCEDFEAVAVGSVPGGAWHALDESCQFQTASFTMGVSAEQHNSGAQSLKITNKHFAQCRLSGAFEAADDFWVRTYEYWESDLDLSNRETLAVDMTPGFRTADDPAVRFGNRSKAPCEEYAGPQVTIIGLAGGESTGCGSRTLPQGQWYCFEAHIQQSDQLIVTTYIDGEGMSYQSTGKPATESVSSESSITEKIDHIRLGLFSTGEAQGIVYIDDVAVSTTRIGCAP